MHSIPQLRVVVNDPNCRIRNSTPTLLQVGRNSCCMSPQARREVFNAVRPRSASQSSGQDHRKDSAGSALPGMPATTAPTPSVLEWHSMPTCRGPGARISHRNVSPHAERTPSSGFPSLRRLHPDGEALASPSVYSSWIRGRARQRAEAIAASRVSTSQILSSVLRKTPSPASGRLGIYKAATTARQRQGAHAGIMTFK